MRKTKRLRQVWKRPLHLLLALTLIVSGLSTAAAPVTAAGATMVVASWITGSSVLTNAASSVTATDGINKAAAAISAVGAGLKYDAQGGAVGGTSGGLVDWRNGFTTEAGQPVPSKYWLATISTENFENLTLDFVQRSGNSGPKNFNVEFSLDNVNWTLLQAVVLSAGQNQSVQIALPAAMNDLQQVFIRWGVTSGDAANPARVLEEWGVNILRDVKIQGDVIAGRNVEVDTEAPTIPANLSGEALSDTSVRLTWDASTDNEAVTGYNVYRDGTKVGAVAAASYTDSNLAIDTEYAYSVTAIDAANNESPASAVVKVKTKSVQKINLASWTITSRGNEGVIAATAGTYKDAATLQNVGGVFEYVDTNANSISYQGWDNGMNQKYWLVTVPTKGYNNITVTSDQNSSGSGPRNFKLQMSTDNKTWTDVPNTNLTMTVSNFNCPGNACKLDNAPVPDAANDQELIYLRWIVSSSFNTNGVEAIGGSGSSRIRDIKVSGELIPGAVIEVPILDTIRSPQHGVVGIAKDAPVAVTFNKAIKLNDGHAVTIADGKGNALNNVTAQIVDGNTLSIGHQGFTYGSTYTVTVPKALVSGTDDSALVRDVVWTFTIVDSPYKPQSFNMTFNGDPRTSMGFAWYTETMTDSVVEVIEASLAPGSTFPENGATAYRGTAEEIETFMVASDRAANNKTKFVSHKVIADNLKPGTAYKFRMGNGEAGSWTPVGSFTTDSAEHQDYRFIVGADSQSSSLSGFEPWGDTFRKAVDYIGDPKFLIVAGDLVDNGDLESHWQWMFNVAEDSMLKVPYVPVLGGHEVNDYDGDVTTDNNNFYYHFNVPKQVVKDTYLGSVYSFEYGDALYMVFNSQYEGGLAENGKDIAWEDPQFRAQVEWMKNTVARTDKKWKFVTFHKSPYASGENSAFYEDERVQFYRQHLIPAFDEMGIDMVFEAHDHMYMRSFQMYGNEVVPSNEIEFDNNGNAVNPKGTVYLMPNAMGNKFYQKQEWLYEALEENNWEPTIKLDEQGNPIPYDHFFADVNEQPNKKMFTDVSVTDQVLSFKSYTAAVADEGAPGTVGNGLFEYDKYGIKRTDVKPDKAEDVKLEVKNNQATLTWNAPAGGEAVRGFRIYEQNDKLTTHWSTYIPVEQGKTSYSYTIEGINPAKKYEFVVRAVGVRMNADPVTVATKEGPDENEPPSAPTNLTATALSPFQVQLNWHASSGNIEVSGYDVYRDDVKIGHTASDVITFTDSGLSPETAYTYYIKALNMIDIESLPSDSVKATTKQAVPVSEQPHKPFPQHVGYVEGSIKPDHLSQEEMDATVVRLYKEWKAKYLKTSPYNDDQKYVWYTDDLDVNNPDDWETTTADGMYFPLTVSEAHGYGMMITALMAGHDPETKADFDDLYRYFRAHPSEINSQLMAWRQGDNGSAIIDVSGVDSATDGDMDIAYALLLADQQWGSGGDINYLAEAKAVINAIMDSEVYKTDWTLRIADWASSGKYAGATRPSDFMLQHMKDYKIVTGDSRWDSTVAGTYGVAEHMFKTYSPNAGLLPDFVIKSGNSFVPATPNWLESPYDGDYYYNSSRVPWRLSTDYLVTGDNRAKEQLMTLNAWIREMADNDPNNIFSGYKLDGSAGLRPSVEEEWQDITFIAPFMVSATIDKSNQQWLNDLWDYSVAIDTEEEQYFGNNIRMLSMIVVSGNWWSPTLVDAEAPTAPTIDYANPVSSSVIDLRWLASSDNLAVAGYDVYRDGVKIATTDKLEFRDQGLSPQRQYAYVVIAFDAAGNRSSSSNMRLVTTMATGGDYVPTNPGTGPDKEPEPEQPGEQDPDGPSKVVLTDINNHWASGAIKRAAAAGIIQGYPDGKFRPDNNMTREQFAVILARALNLQSSAALSFKDQDKLGAWSKAGVEAAVSAGIILGYTDGTFRPNQAVTRAEMAMMLARAVETKINAAATTKFADDQAIPAWAKGAVALTHELGILEGIGGNRFAPEQQMTRAEAVVAALRLTDHFASLEKNAQP